LEWPMDPYKGLHNSNCIHTESFYSMGCVTFGSPCITVCSLCWRHNRLISGLM
jgi:hypothetical protein